MKIKILVVDDESDLELLIRQKFRRQIRDGLYEFLFAANGQEALDRVAEHPDTDVILSDINMPVMDGLTLLTHLPELNPILKTVIVSAYGDIANIRTAMNRGAFDFIFKPVDFLDLEVTIEKTGHQVRQLRQGMEHLRENHILKMFVNETVIQFMARPGVADRLLASEMVEATVLFVDICGFTGLAERLPAPVVVDLLNSYFDVMAQAILVEQGYIDKFIGDAVMAVFRGEDHLHRALRAALGLRERLNTADPALLPAGITQAPAVAIGVNTGEMVSGNIGSASLRRLDFTVVGDAVNLSQRLQAAAQPDQILISEATWLLARDHFHCQPVGHIALKNKAQPVMTYEVLGRL